LIYLAAEAEFIGCAEVATAVHDWSPSEAAAYPGDSPSGCCCLMSRAGTPLCRWSLSCSGSIQQHRARRSRRTPRSASRWASCGSTIRVPEHARSQPRGSGYIAEPSPWQVFRRWNVLCLALRWTADCGLSSTQSFRLWNRFGCDGAWPVTAGRIRSSLGTEVTRTATGDTMGPKTFQR
jgi:hypothetical protein